MNKEDSFARKEIDDKIRIMTYEIDGCITAYFVYEPAPNVNSSQSGTFIWQGCKSEFPWEEGEEKSQDNFQKKLVKMANKMRRELEAQTNLKKL